MKVPKGAQHYKEQRSSVVQRYFALKVPKGAQHSKEAAMEEINMLRQIALMVRPMTLVVLLSFFTTSSTEACAQMEKCLLLHLIDLFCLYIVHEYYPESYNISVLLSTSDSICRFNQ